MDLGVHAQLLIAGKHEDVGVLRLLQGVVVEFNVPDAGCSVERFASLGSVDEALLGGGVGTH